MTLAVWLAAFAAGFFAPYTAWRLPKAWPADAGTAWALMLAWPRRLGCPRMLRVRLRRWAWGAAWGLASVAFVWTAPEGAPYWHIGLFFLLASLVMIDALYELLPDIYTVPLLVLGVAYGVFVRDDPQGMAVGALMGYFLPAFSSFIMYPIYRREMGGGDVKMLAAVGAWLGYEGLIASVLVSAVVFGAQAAVLRRRRLAYGPAIVLATIVVFLTQSRPELRPVFDYLRWR
ncbi:hypothetical protein FACS1894186_4520 [Alphaproteobacteria bacterium]|nr:hypothetical protein FACS1894186_4520 [Alphaproteobacteria bacterium]